MATRRMLFWRSVGLLSLAAVAGTGLMLPYVMEMQAKALAKAGLSLGGLIAVSLIQTAAAIIPAAILGLWAAGKLGLRAPVVEALAEGRVPGWNGVAVRWSLLAGLLSGAAVMAGDRLVFASAVASAGLHDAAAWKGLLAAFYGGIDEEIVARLFILSIIALGLQAIATRGRPGSQPLFGWAFWSANLGAAVLFGLGHLPGTSGATTITATLVVRALVLNALVALPCGALFRRFGLEAAMLAHFGADLVIHGAAPLLFG